MQLTLRFMAMMHKNVSLRCTFGEHTRRPKIATWNTVGVQVTASFSNDMNDDPTGFIKFFQHRVWSVFPPAADPVSLSQDRRQCIISSRNIKYANVLAPSKIRCSEETEILKNQDIRGLGTQTRKQIPRFVSHRHGAGWLAEEKPHGGTGGCSTPLLN